ALARIGPGARSALSALIEALKDQDAGVRILRVDSNSFIEVCERLVFQGCAGPNSASASRKKSWAARSSDRRGSPRSLRRGARVGRARSPRAARDRGTAKAAR